jgi:hypothetical protein
VACVAETAPPIPSSTSQSGGYLDGDPPTTASGSVVGFAAGPAPTEPEDNALPQEAGNPVADAAIIPAPDGGPLEAGPEPPDAGPPPPLKPACYAVSLDDITSTISAPATGWTLGGGDWTLEAWVKVRSTADATRETIIQLNQAYTTDGLGLAFDDSTGNVIAGTYGGSCPCGPGTGNLDMFGGDVRGGWHHVAATRHEGNAWLYVDGLLVKTDVIDTRLLVQSDLGIGAMSGYPASAFDGIVGPVRFSRVVRYTGSFTPETNWAVDSNTVTQYLTTKPFAGGVLTDEAGSDNTSTASGHVSPSEDTPCN